MKPKKKGQLIFRINAEDETPCMSYVVFAPDSGSYNFLLNNVEQTIELHDADGNSKSEIESD